MLAIISLLGGLLFPVITVSKFILITNTFSVVGGVIQLLKDGQIFLFLIIGLFSVLLPITKLALIARWIYCKEKVKNTTLLRLIHTVGKWSMLDVFVVAVLVVALKLAGLASVKMEYGLYFFTAAVILTMVLTHQVSALVEHDNA